MTFQLTVPGIPKPQGRPRAFRAGDKIRMYDPDVSRDWKRTVLHCAAREMKDRGWSPFEGAIIVDLHFDLPRPKSLPKRVLYHVKRPDCSNYAKAVEDALKGVVYVDDSQIISLHVTKSYSPTPCAQISVREA